MALVCLRLNWHFGYLPVQLLIHIFYFYFFNFGALEGIYFNASHFLFFAVTSKIHKQLFAKSNAIVSKLMIQEVDKKSQQILRLKILFKNHCTLNSVILGIELANRTPVLLLLASIAPISIVLTNMLLFDHLISWYAKLLMTYVVIFCNLAFYFSTFYFSAINKSMFSLEQPAKKLLLMRFSPLQKEGKLNGQVRERLKLLQQYEYLSGGSSFGSSGCSNQHGITIGGIAVITPFISYKVK